MITVDTCGITAYSPLIPAIKAMCTASPGETIEIIMNHADAFQDLKEYLSEQGIGFREHLGFTIFYKDSKRVPKGAL